MQSKNHDFVSFCPQHRQILIFRTHFWDESCARTIAGLRQALGQMFDIIVTGFVQDPAAIPAPAGIPYFFSTRADLADLHDPLSLGRLKPHHIDHLRFFRQYPDYKHYWLIEFDVRYSGNWAVFMREMAESKADILATVVQSRAEHPQWAHWQTLQTAGAAVPEDCFVKIFTPLLRLSNAATRAVGAAYKAGWTGHYEAVWPTAAAAAGLLVEDIGGTGSFTPASRYGRHYSCSAFNPYLSPGSFVFRPSILETDIQAAPPRLWHPVKPARMTAPIPPPPPPRWRDAKILQPLRRWWRGHKQPRHPQGPD